MANMDIVNRVIKKLTSDELLNLRDYWRMEDKLNYNNGYMKGYNAAKKKYKKQFNSEPNGGDKNA